MKLYRQICILFPILLACQSAPPVEENLPPVKEGPPSFTLKSDQLETKEQGQLKLQIPFDDTWKVYQVNDSVDEDHQTIIAHLQERISDKTLFFGVSEKFYAKTQYLVNNNPKATLKVFADYLKRTAYKDASKAKDLGPIETLSGIQGQLLQYQIGKEIYFELIYQIQEFFLRTSILTPISNYKNAEEFSLAKDYVMGILKGISLEKEVPLQEAEEPAEDDFPTQFSE